jgi:hypothetical protein
MIEIKLRFKHEPRHSHGVPFQRPKWGTNVNIKCSTNVKLFNHACLHHTIVSSCPSPSQDSDALHSSGINGTRWHRLYFLLHQPVSHLVPRWRFCFQFRSKRFIVALCFWALINEEGSKGQAAMRSKSLKFHLLGDILQVTGARIQKYTSGHLWPAVTRQGLSSAYSMETREKKLRQWVPWLKSSMIVKHRMNTVELSRFPKNSSHVSFSAFRMRSTWSKNSYRSPVCLPGILTG